MRKTTGRLLAFALALLCLAPLSPAAFAEEPQALSASLDAYIAEHEETTAGLAVSVFDREGVICERLVGFADRERGIPVTEETVFEWGSATKLLVWVSAMQLCEQGKLELDRDVRDYLPEDFLTNLRFDAPVTMTHLMNHDAGFQELLVEIFLPEGNPIPTLEEALKKHEPEQVYEPGTVTAYSNWGVALAGYIVERVSGQSFADYVHEHIFEPLGMAHTAIRPDLSDNAWVKERRDRLSCYTAEGKSLGRSFYSIPLYPCGMCTGTPEDFTRFARALLDDSAPLFASPAGQEALFTPSSFYGDGEAPRNCHGFWVLPLGVPAVGHGGNTAGCSSYLLLDREDGRGVTVMTNQSAETIYNVDMMPLVFGEPADSGRSFPSGMFRNARVVRHGPLRLSSLSFLTAKSEEQIGSWFLDGDKLEFPYGDAIRTPAGTLVLELGLVSLWAVGLLYALGSLLAWPLGALIRRLRRRERAGRDGKLVLRRAAAWLQLLLLLTLGIGIAGVAAYQPGARWLWAFALTGPVALAMLALTVPLLKRREEPHPARWRNALSALFLLAAAANVLYWQTWQFWVT